MHIGSGKGEKKMDIQLRKYLQNIKGIEQLQENAEELNESTPAYRKMMQRYKGSDNEKVFKMLRAKGYKVGEQDDTLVSNLLKRHRGNVKKVVDQIVKDYPGKFDSAVQLGEAETPFRRKILSAQDKLRKAGIKSAFQFGEIYVENKDLKKAERLVGGDKEVIVLGVPHLRPDEIDENVKIMFKGFDKEVTDFQAKLKKFGFDKQYVKMMQNFKKNANPGDGFYVTMSDRGIGFDIHPVADMMMGPKIKKLGDSQDLGGGKTATLLAIKEDANLGENIVSDKVYRASHGKKPNPNESGGWYFGFSTHPDDIVYQSPKEMKYKDAKIEAEKVAKEKGLKKIYVMDSYDPELDEDVQLDEEYIKARIDFGMKSPGGGRKPLYQVYDELRDAKKKNMYVTHKETPGSEGGRPDMFDMTFSNRRQFNRFERAHDVVVVDVLDEETQHTVHVNVSRTDYRNLEAMIASLDGYKESDYSDGKARFYFDAKKHDSAERKKVAEFIKKTRGAEFSHAMKEDVQLDERTYNIGPVTTYMFLEELLHDPEATFSDFLFKANSGDKATRRFGDYFNGVDYMVRDEMMDNLRLFAEKAKSGDAYFVYRKDLKDTKRGNMGFNSAVMPFRGNPLGIKKLGDIAVGDDVTRELPRHMDYKFNRFVNPEDPREYNYTAMCVMIKD